MAKNALSPAAVTVAQPLLKTTIQNKHKKQHRNHAKGLTN
jgi:hypothetical protein